LQPPPVGGPQKTGGGIRPQLAQHGRQFPALIGDFCPRCPVPSVPPSQAIASRARADPSGHVPSQANASGISNGDWASGRTNIMFPLPAVPQPADATPLGTSAGKIPYRMTARFIPVHAPNGSNAMVNDNPRMSQPAIPGRPRKHEPRVTSNAGSATRVSVGADACTDLGHTSASTTLVIHIDTATTPNATGSTSS
jgi:hypothetical protein